MPPQECKKILKKALFNFTPIYLLVHTHSFSAQLASGVTTERSLGGQLVSIACVGPKRMKQVRRLNSEWLAGRRNRQFLAKIQKLFACRHFFYQRALVEMVATCLSSQGLIFLLLRQFIFQEAVNVNDTNSVEACSSCPDGGFRALGTVHFSWQCHA